MTKPDPREVFLARAAARDRLVQSGDMSLDEAFDGLVPAFFAIVDEWISVADPQPIYFQPLRATDEAREIHSRFNKLMAPCGRIDWILRGRA